MAGSKKLLVLGLDAANPALLRSWAADGTLPNVARLLATGLVAETRNVDAFEGATWPTFYTAVNPGEHGFYWQQQLRSGTYRIHECVPTDFCRRPTLWEVLSEAGHRVAILDVPLSHRSRGLNGVQCVEWGGHDRIYGFEAEPTGFQRELLQTAGPYPMPERCDTAQRSAAEYHEFADRLVQAAGLGAKLGCRVLREEPWDFAMQVFGESHCAGHQLWHSHDPEHPGFDPAATLGDLVREVYVSLDAAIGAILSEVPENAMVVLLTLHGMTHTWGAGILLPEILVRLGVTQLAAAAAPGKGGGGSQSLLRAAYHTLPEAIRRPIYAARQRVNREVLGRGSPLDVDIDPRNSQCFYLHVGRTYSGIRLNLKGREPLGALTPGVEAEQFTERLTRELLAISDPSSGIRLVRSVHRTAELFHGSSLDQLPDLVADWNPEFALGTAVAGTGKGARIQGSSPKIGLVEGVNRYCRTGDHELNGMFVVRGPGFAAGRLSRVVPNIDLAPTLARLMGTEMRNVDGRPVPELLPG